uniref:C-type lectin domain-containing protein n=1 Tax=Monopterus albus TaxID=43700 RepID=A0A3Q3K4D2_MONAL
ICPPATFFVHSLTAGTQLVFINEAMNWFRAWRYCKENFTDLTILRYSSEFEYNDWLSAVASLVPSEDQAWIGLITRPHMLWSDGNITGFIGDMNVVADLQRSGKWRLMPWDTRLPFVCYDFQTAKGWTQI